MPLHRRKANSSGQNQPPNYTEEMRDTPLRKRVHVLVKRLWFERGVKEAIFTKLGRPSLKHGGGFPHRTQRSASLSCIMMHIDESYCNTVYKYQGFAPVLNLEN